MSPEKFITGHRPDILAGISTGIVWLVILCILLLIPVSRQSQPEYTEVSIILEPSSEAVAFSGRNPREATFAAEPEQSEQTKQYDVADETAAIQDIPAGSENPLITAGTPISRADSVIIGGQHSATESPSSALTDGIGNSVQDSGRQAAGDAGFISELATVPSEPAETAATGTRMVSGSPKMSAEILSEPVPDSTEPQQLYKSIDQLMAEQAAADAPRVSRFLTLWRYNLNREVYPQVPCWKEMRRRHPVNRETAPGFLHGQIRYQNQTPETALHPVKQQLPWTGYARFPLPVIVFPGMCHIQ